MGGRLSVGGSWRFGIAVVAIGAALVAGVAGSSAQAPPDPIPEGYSHQILNLKFVESADVRLRGDELVTVGDDNLTAVKNVLANYPGVEIERLFDSLSEAQLAQEERGLEAETGKQVADKNLYYRLRIPAQADEVALINDLNALGIVQVAYPAPLQMPDPNHAGPTPSFVNFQAYLTAAPNGIDSNFAAAIPGGRGQNVRIIDIERDWQRTHEDLTKANLPGAFIPNKTTNPGAGGNDHGTAVIGEMVADNNAFGVTGAADGAGLGLVNSRNTEDGFDLADSITIAHNALNDGDVILIEVQIAGPNGCDADTQVGCVAVEWDQAIYDAIRAATLDGIIVIEPAGNGAQDLDHAPTYGNPFPSGRADSGAIVVGAGAYPGCTNPTHGRLDFSNSGARVNLHGYGQCVATTGYGSLQDDPNNDFDYADDFGGTSSASPIVASAAAVMSSVAQARGDANGLNSTEARAALAVGATPQDTTTSGALAGNIGPMPDLADALRAAFDSDPPETTINSGPSGLTADNTPTFTFSSDESGSTFECSVDQGTASFGPCSGPGAAHTTAALADGTYTFRVRASDVYGNADPDPATRSFTVDTTPPETTIDTGPSGPTNDPTPTFTFSANEAATFECSIDQGTASFAACSGPGASHTPVANLAEGSYTFRVRATDQVGNVELTPETRSFTVDVTPPETTIDSGPPALTNDTTPNFTFSSNEAGSTFECRVDGVGTFVGCSSPLELAPLADGFHTFEVRAIDPATNVDPTPAQRSFEIRQCTISGNNANNSIVGTRFNDVICGFGGNDNLTGGGGVQAGGNDIVFGGTGNDAINDGRGNNRLWGEEGADKITAGPGDDQLNGGPGSPDVCNGGFGTDTAAECESVSGVP